MAVGTAKANEGRIEARLRYLEQLQLDHVAALIGRETELYLVHRTDHHEDGSQSETYFLELDPAQFQKLHVYPFDCGEAGG